MNFLWHFNTCVFVIRQTGPQLLCVCPFPLSIPKHTGLSPHAHAHAHRANMQTLLMVKSHHLSPSPCLAHKWQARQCLKRSLVNNKAHPCARADAALGHWVIYVWCARELCVVGVGQTDHHFTPRTCKNRKIIIGWATNVSQHVNCPINGLFTFLLLEINEKK